MPFAKNAVVWTAGHSFRRLLLPRAVDYAVLLPPGGALLSMSIQFMVRPDDETARQVGDALMADASAGSMQSLRRDCAPPEPRP
jgi:hypothetical protein